MIVSGWNRTMPLCASCSVQDSCQSYARRLRKHLLIAGVNRAELHHNVAADKQGRGGMWKGRAR